MKPGTASGIITSVIRCLIDTPYTSAIKSLFLGILTRVLIFTADNKNNVENRIVIIGVTELRPKPMIDKVDHIGGGVTPIRKNTAIIH